MMLMAISLSPSPELIHLVTEEKVKVGRESMREDGGSSGETRRLEEKTGMEAVVVVAVVGDVCGDIRRRRLRWQGCGLPATS